MNVYQKLNAARTEFHSLQLKKTGHNKFAGYYYFELGDFLIPAMTVFEKHGLCAVVSFDADKACMLIRNTEKPDEYITIYSPMGSAQLKGCHEVQNIGAVETYQRRYLWVAALEIVEHDALDATTGKDEKTARQAAPKAGVKAAIAETSTPLPKEETEYLDELADKVLQDVAGGASLEEIFNKLEEENLENEHKIYLSTLLPSKVNNGLKAISLARRKQAVEA